MRIGGMRGWLRTVLALVVAATAIATAHAEQIADRFEQAREEGVVVVYAATDLEVVKPVIDDRRDFRYTARFHHAHLLTV
jgi:iron(III) transport system substrate-binding protein